MAAETMHHKDIKARREKSRAGCTQDRQDDAVNPTGFSSAVAQVSLAVLRTLIAVVLTGVASAIFWFLPAHGAEPPAAPPVTSRERPLSPKVLSTSLSSTRTSIESEGGRRLSQVCGWNDPDGVDYKAVIEQYNLARLVVQATRLHPDGPPWPQPGRLHHKSVGEFGAPYFGYWESTMAGKGAYFCNSPPVEGINCSRIFVIMGFHYERGVGEMLENFGHRTESIMRRVYGSF